MTLDDKLSLAWGKNVYNHSLTWTQAKKLKNLEKENARLRHLVADLSLDNAILKEVLSKK